MNAPTDNPWQLAAIELQGDVQGSGIRPLVARLANRFGVRGSVRNCQLGVHITACARQSVLIEFRQALAQAVPGGRIEQYLHAWQDLQAGFTICDSDTTGAARFVLPLDRVTCDECLQESLTPGNRRFGYELNSCATCGPRYTMIRAMPYDRQRTSMAEFPMCAACLDEYRDPSHRRYHAQTNSCPRCGPTVWFEDADQDKSQDKSQDKGHLRGFSSAVLRAARAIVRGQVLALKGIGGYQLICDATCERRSRGCAAER